MFVIASLLFDTEESGLTKRFDCHLGYIIIQKVMIYLNNPMSLQIENLDFAVGNIQNDYLFFVDHSEEVNNVFVLVFPQNFTIFIQMNDALLLARVVNSH